MRFLGRSLTALFLLALTFGLLGLAGNSIYTALEARWAQEDRARPARERVFAVNVIEAQARDTRPELRVFAEIQAARVLELRTPSSGTIVELADGFEEGGRVRAGQLLLRLDPAEMDAALASARNDLSEAEADARDAARLLVLARAEVDAARAQADLRDAALTRQKSLLERGVGTDAAVETAALALSSAEQVVLTRRQALASAEARVDQTATNMERRRIALREAQRERAQTEIFAEFDGTLSAVTVAQGGRVGANEKIAEVIDPTELEAAIRVSTAQHSRLVDADGQLRRAPAQVVLDVLGMDITARATLTREAPAVGDGQTGRLVFATLDAPGSLRPGDLVEVRIQEPQLDDVIRLPATALSAQNRVLILGADDRLEEVSVTLMRRQGDDILIRAPGLEGQQVVAERTPLLGAGIKVRPLGPQADSTPETDDLVELTVERRAAIVAYIEADCRLSDEAKRRMLARLSQDKVPAAMVARIESRMGS